MNKDDLKILQSDYDKTRVSRLPDRPNVGRAMGGQGLSAQELKARLDASSALIVERFNALIEALAGVDEDGERCEGVADLIMTGIGEGYSLADLFAGLASGEAAQRIKAGIGEYTLKGYLQYIKQITDELEKEQDTVKDTVSKTIEKAVEEAEKAAENAIIDEIGDAREAATVAQNAATTANAAATRAEAVLKEAIGQAKNDKTLYANALKGTATGEAVKMDDVSPLPHEMAVKVRGVEDISAVKVLKYGKNLFSPNAPMAGSISDVYTPSIKVERLDSGCRISTSADHTATTERIAYQVIPIDMVRGKTITLSFKRYSEADDTNVSTCALVQVADTELEGDYTYKGGSLNNRLSYKEMRMKDAVDGYFAVTFTVPQTETRKNLFILFYIGERAVMTQGSVVEYHDIQVEIDGKATDFSPYITPTEYTPNADGTVDGVTALHPTTTLMTDTVGAVLDVGYNRDINKAFEQLVNAIISQGGNV